MTCDTCYVTHDTALLTHDSQRVVHIVSKCPLPGSNRLGVLIFLKIWRKRFSELISDKGVCRAAPATPGLLNIFIGKTWLQQVVTKHRPPLTLVAVCFLVHSLLAAPSSSRSLVFGLSVCWSVCRSVGWS